MKRKMWGPFTPVSARAFMGLILVAMSGIAFFVVAALRGGVGVWATILGGDATTSLGVTTTTGGGEGDWAPLPLPPAEPRGEDAGAAFNVTEAAPLPLATLATSSPPPSPRTVGPTVAPTAAATNPAKAVTTSMEPGSGSRLRPGEKEVQVAERVETLVSTARPTGMPSRPQMIKPINEKERRRGGRLTWADIQQSSSSEENHNLGLTIFYVVAGNVLPGQNLGEEIDSVLLSDKDDYNGRFIIHLGGFDDPANSTGCNVEAYELEAQRWSSSSSLKSLPVLFVPGDKEWSFCPDLIAALGRWTDVLASGRVPSRYSDGEHSVWRMYGRPDNFAFFHRGVMYVGINAASEPLPDNSGGHGDGNSSGDSDKSPERILQNLAWLKANVSTYHSYGIELLVIFGHHSDMGVGGTEGTGGTFSSSGTLLRSALTEYKESWGIHTLVVIPTTASNKKDIVNDNGDEGTGLGLEETAWGIEGVALLRVEEGAWPPTTIRVDTGSNFLDYNQ